MRAFVYDALLAHREVKWTKELYGSFARSVSGPVLELGAGTGHVLAELLRRGVDAFGLELEPAMLARGRQHLRYNGVRDAKSRLVVGDMFDFSHARRYGAVILPYNTIAMVTEPADIARLLAAVADHMLPGGELMFDMSLPVDQDWTTGLWERPRLLLDYEGYCLTVLEKGRFDAETGRHRWIQEIALPDGQNFSVIRELQHWTPETMKKMIEAEGWRFVLPPIDQTGQQISPDSRLYVARIGRV